MHLSLEYLFPFYIKKKINVCNYLKIYELKFNLKNVVFCIEIIEKLFLINCVK